MPNGIRGIHRIIFAVVLTVAVGGLGWAILSVHRFGPAFQYRMETMGARNIEVVHLGEADTETYFNGTEGYAWEIKPVQITPQEALVEIRIEHLYHAVALDSAREELRHVPLRVLTLHSMQPVSIPVEGGAPALLTPTLY